ncbi:MAG: N-acetylmuramoyl-L-alanine amidase [Bacteroidetes bacterium]|nr:N-acetylmuramoyl-L-alanine amidase [Bacteroidota bacterium]
MRKFFTCIIIFLPGILFSREEQLPKNNYTTYFEEAYATYPDIPRGILEAVAFTNTKFNQLTGNEIGCMGMPVKFSVMGLMENGQNWFRNNLAVVDSFSVYTSQEIKTDPRKSILAYAEAFHHFYSMCTNMHYDHCGGNRQIYSTEESVKLSIMLLNELPIAESNDSIDSKQKDFVQDTWLYDIFTFLNDANYSSTYNFPKWNVDLNNLFGTDNFKILSSKHVSISRDVISDENGNNFRQDNSSNEIQSADYPPAIWNPAASCNYTVGRTQAISAVTIHDIEGSYAGAISWFQNCAAQVSAHYVVRSSDGQITQMVLEANKAWHVGTENPYTIGIEHEGYASQTGWYTNAMYTESAALVRDICASNSIDPLRCGWWPWLATTYYNQSGIPGACTKIKGHQHFPNQTHNDPGPNWDWEYYYELINNNPPAAGMLTTASGNFYDLGGPSANYFDNERSIWTIAPASASSITINFNSFDVENTWDYLFIYDGADINAPLIGYYTGTNGPGTITSSGGSLTFEFRSDCATNNPGWDATWTSTQIASADAIAPTTSVSVNGIWQTQDFSTNFSESDNSGGSGLAKSFFQVIDYDGADWRANNSQGFFSDNFDLAAINSEWSSVTGTWTLTNGALNQTDQSLTNTNIYAPLTQNLSNQYLYNWAGKIDGTGNNRRAGLHFFVDQPTLTNRGNNYFVWFRVDQSVCEWYKVTNDVFSLEHSVPMTVNANQWYDWKVIYDRTTGEIGVYQDNIFVGSWTDPSPISNGNYISFRSGNCDWQVDNFKIYRSRYSNTPQNISVGNCASCMLRYENPDPATPAGRVKSIVRDSANNLSSVAYQDVNVDWTTPLAIPQVNDGNAADIDLSTSATNLDANWSATTDPNSGVSTYYFALGSTSGDSDVVMWTNTVGNDSAFLSNLSLANGQWYYFSVRAENGAGLVTQNFTSDGVLINLTLGISSLGTNGFSVSAGPNPFSNSTVLSYSLAENSKVKIELHDAAGRVIRISDEEETAGQHRFDVDAASLGLSTGIYLVTFDVGGKQYSLPVIKQ